jgi:hypothetical protein
MQTAASGVLAAGQIITPICKARRWITSPLFKRVYGRRLMASRHAPQIEGRKGGTLTWLFSSKGKVWLELVLATLFIPLDSKKSKESGVFVTHPPLRYSLGHQPPSELKKLNCFKFFPVAKRIVDIYETVGLVGTLKT